MDLMRVTSALVGLVVIFMTFYWAARILMVKGTDPPWLARLVFRASRNALHFIGDRMPSNGKRRELWALYIPVSLLSILASSLILANIAFTLLLYGTTQNSLRTAYIYSVSAMSTMGSAGQPGSLIETSLSGVEAFTGPVFVALLIAYTVSIYSAYSNYRSQVAAMDEALDTNQDGLDLLSMLCDPDGPESLTSIWSAWKEEFDALDRSYRSVDGYLLFFAPEMSKHWAHDGPMVLDAAALRNSLISGPPDPSASDCLASGVNALGHLAQHYRHRVIRMRPHHPRQTIDRAAFDVTARALAACGVTVAPNLDSAWDAFQAQQHTYVENVATLRRMLPISKED